jgi:flavodoxin I
MKKVGLFFGSDTGNTERIADLIADKLGKDNIEIIDLHNAAEDEMDKYENLIFGAPTWYDGELQSDWDNYIDNFEQIDFSNKTVAMFGLGDQYAYSDYFLDALGIIYDKLVERNGEVVGKWPKDEYEYDHSKAERGDMLLGLGIDEDNESEKTEERLDKWLEQIKPSFGLN